MKKMKHTKKSMGKVMTSVLLGSVVGATVGWLSAPVVGNGSRRYAQHGNPHPIPEVGRSANRRSLEEKIKTSEDNVESQARELAAQVDENDRDITTNVFRHRKTSST